ncbi:hypothetical protein HMN09_00209200 [Mycena chlorophos]|uniref:Uncharacterized protein n=1 Tax=Mycena chlorophos TaxID=658473 RepID=A0A8H6TR00_MYCCL|nr:hypothetical protein HMN09_00209200 [Mycena chlorophos]
MSSDEALDNLRAAYHVLERNVIRALQAHQGAQEELAYQIREVLQLLSAAERHRDGFPPEEWAILEKSIRDMLDALNAAHDTIVDPLPPASTSFQFVSRTATGGRPRIDINPAVLGEAMSLRSKTDLQIPLSRSDLYSIDPRIMHGGHDHTIPGSFPTPLASFLAFTFPACYKLHWFKAFVLSS